MLRKDHRAKRVNRPHKAQIDIFHCLCASGSPNLCFFCLHVRCYSFCLLPITGGTAFFYKPPPKPFIKLPCRRLGKCNGAYHADIRPRLNHSHHALHQHTRLTRPGSRLNKKVGIGFGNDALP